MMKLPDSELEVMQIIWSYQGAVSRDMINQKLQALHPIAQTTLLTLLSRLEKKEYIRIYKEGKITYYEPIIQEETYLADQSKNFFQQLCRGNIKTFANALNDSGISKEDLEELKEFLERLK